MKEKVKKIRFILLFVFLALAITGRSSAERIVFPDYSTSVTALELDLKLFDLKVNYLKILSSSSYQYLSWISSKAFADNKITCYVTVSPSIMIGSLDERKKRLDKLCNDLFREYQDRFFMMDRDYQKKPEEVGQPAFSIKPCNLKIVVHTNETPSKYLAQWECNSMSYKEDFLAK
jgi:hypothetical protein